MEVLGSPSSSDDSDEGFLLGVGEVNTPNFTHDRSLAKHMKINRQPLTPMRSHTPSSNFCNQVPVVFLTHTRATLGDGFLTSSLQVADAAAAAASDRPHRLANLPFFASAIAKMACLLSSVQLPHASQFYASANFHLSDLSPAFLGCIVRRPTRSRLFAFVANGRALTQSLSLRRLRRAPFPRRRAAAGLFPPLYPLSPLPSIYNSKPLTSSIRAPSCSDRASVLRMSCRLQPSLLPR
jgi:hypothetical protein